MKNIKIFVSHRIDKKNKIVDNDLYVPIRCGAIFDKNANPSVMLGDNTGDNVSDRRLSLCELTVLYWAWKNQEADYYGLCHYRRYFDFTHSNEKILTGVHDINCLNGGSLNTSSINKFRLNDVELMKDEIQKYDAIFVNPIDLKKYKIKSNYEAMVKNPQWHFQKDVNLMMDVIKEKSPFIYEVAKEYMFNYQYSYLYNCFIMKKEIFNQYCEWLFGIVFELEKLIDTTGYTMQQYRAVGTIAERLTGIFILYLMKQNKNIKHLPLIFFENTDKNEEALLPAFNENNIAIAMSSSNEYVPYLSTCLQSLKEHTSSDTNYDIVIFERNITTLNKEILKKQIKQTNISLRFVNPSNLLNNYNLKFPPHYNLECYFRLVAPLIFKNYKKIIFTDVDLLFNADPIQLYNIDIKDKPIGAVQDYIWGIFVNNLALDWKKYAIKTLELDELYKYFNTGVMLLNVEEFNKNEYSRKLLELVSKTQFRILEQDGLNKFFKTDIEYIDSAWNFPTLNAILASMKEYMPFEFINKYKNDRENPKIIHFAGGLKPWFYPDEEFADIWWSYARKTPFYELILKRMMEHVACGFAGNVDHKISTVKNYRKNILNYWKYKILSNFVFGKTRERYFTKKHLLKSKIRQAKQLRK